MPLCNYILLTCNNTQFLYWLQCISILFLVREYSITYTQWRQNVNRQFFSLHITVGIIFQQLAHISPLWHGWKVCRALELQPCPRTPKSHSSDISLKQNPNMSDKQSTSVEMAAAFVYHNTICPPYSNMAVMGSIHDGVSKSHQINKPNISITLLHCASQCQC